MPKLEEQSQYTTNYLTGKGADFINFETVVSTTDDHHMNAQRMLESVKDSLDYFGEQFSPYQYRQPARSKRHRPIHKNDRPQF